VLQTAVLEIELLKKKSHADEPQKLQNAETIEMQAQISLILCFNACRLWPVAWLQRALCHSHHVKITW